MDTEFVSLQKALVERYSLERQIGQGGMGTVYLARDLLLERSVAIKALPLQFADRDEARERFLREARTAAALQHPNIVPIHAVEQLDHWIIIVMAYIDGGTLGERIRARTIVPPDETSRIVRDVSLALAYAHRRGVIHRDVKPDNVLIDRESGRALVADFGIASVATGTTISGPGLMLGTPSYMSPEQAGGATIDGRSDFYSLGVVMYYCLTGRLPFVGPDSRSVLAQHLTQTPPAIESVAPGVPLDVARVAAKCLEKDPAARFQSGEDIAAALDASVPKKRDLPAALRMWTGLPGELTFSEALGTPLLIMGVWFALDFFLNPLFQNVGPRVFDGDVGIVVGFVLPLPIYLLRRAQLLRRVRSAGYGISDLRDALRTQHLDRGDQARSGSPVRTMLLGLTVGGILAGMMRFPPAPGHPQDLGDLLFKALLVSFSVGAVIQGAYQLLRKGRRLSNEIREFAWKSPVGEWLLKLAGTGLRGRQQTPEFGNRGTELALGSAAMVLYEALPRDLRRRLTELPRAIRRLEAVALEQRDRAGALRDAGTDEGSEMPSAAVVARDRRQAALAALQVFRLDLLRLHAHDNDAGSITSDIEAALDLSRRLQIETEALDEVARLGLRTPSLRQVTP